jgi:hypothetical protein
MDNHHEEFWAPYWAQFRSWKAILEKYINRLSKLLNEDPYDNDDPCVKLQELILILAHRSYIYETEGRLAGDFQGNLALEQFIDDTRAHQSHAFDDPDFIDLTPNDWKDLPWVANLTPEEWNHLPDDDDLHAWHEIWWTNYIRGIDSIEDAYNLLLEFHQEPGFHTDFDDTRYLPGDRKHLYRNNKLQMLKGKFPNSFYEFSNSEHPERELYEILTRTLIIIERVCHYLAGRIPELRDWTKIRTMPMQ